MCKIELKHALAKREDDDKHVSRNQYNWAPHDDVAKNNSKPIVLVLYAQFFFGLCSVRLGLVFSSAVFSADLFCVSNWALIELQPIFFFYSVNFFVFCKLSFFYKSQLIYADSTREFWR